MRKINYQKISISELAALVHSEFEKRHMKTILVGGACVAIYSNHKYMSHDLDFVTYETKGRIKEVLSELGFEPIGKYFAHSKCPFYIEFVTPPVAVGDEEVHQFKTLSTPFGRLEMLTPTDCIKDRLASFYHWDDRQAFEQALMVFFAQKVDLKELERWSKAENYHEKFKLFKEIAQSKQ